jgi:hypothetical protein
MNEGRRRWALGAAGAALLAVLAVKSIAVFLSAFAVADLTEQRQAMLAAGKAPTPRQLADELIDFLSAARWAPGDADIWYALGRNLHRLADDGTPVPAVARQALAAAFSLPLPPSAVEERAWRLTAARAAYDRAIAANQLVSGARFWRLAAQLAEQPTDPRQWAARIKPEVERALVYDAQDPAMRRAAGELALAHDDLPTALQWFRASLTWKLDGLEEVVEALLSTPDGDRRLGEAIPNTAEAWRRLARYLFSLWRVDTARWAFLHAMRLAGTTPIWMTGEQALLDGDFSADPERMLHPWVIEPARGVQLAREAAPSDPVGLTAVFEGGPGNWYHVTQLAPVEPGRRYRLSARVRVQGFGADETLGVEAVHPFDPALFAANAKCYAAPPDRHSGRREGWPVSAAQFVRVEQEFVVPDGLRMLSVRLRRFGGESLRSGRVWFTDVSLEELPPSPPAPAAEGL